MPTALLGIQHLQQRSARHVSFLVLISVFFFREFHPNMTRTISSHLRAALGFYPTRCLWGSCRGADTGAQPYKRFVLLLLKERGVLNTAALTPKLPSQITLSLVCCCQHRALVEPPRVNRTRGVKSPLPFLEEPSPADGGQAEARVSYAAPLGAAEGGLGSGRGRGRGRSIALRHGAQCRPAARRGSGGGAGGRDAALSGLLPPGPGRGHGGHEASAALSPGDAVLTAADHRVSAGSVRTESGAQSGAASAALRGCERSLLWIVTSGERRCWERAEPGLYSYN